MYHSFLLTAEMSSHLPRCTAPSNDLDTLDAIPWTHAHTDVLVNTGGVELQELWDDYGIVGDIVVCHGSAGTPLGTHANGEDTGLEESRKAIYT
jgi:hypothetical protein